MQEDNFNDYLKKHAEDFEINPSSEFFEAILQKRTRATRRRNLVGWAAASLICMLGVAIAYLSDRDYTDNQSTAIVKSEQGLVTPIAGTETATEKRTQTNSYLIENQNNKTTKATEKNQRQVASFVLEAKEKSHEQPIMEKKGSTKASNSVLRHPDQSQNQLLADNTKAPIMLQEENKDVVRDVFVANDDHKKEKSGDVSDNMGVESITSNIENKGIDSSMVVSNEQTTTVESNNSKSTSSEIETIQGPKQRKWAISAFATPNLINSAYSANSDVEVGWINRYLENRKKNDKAKISYNGGLKVEREILPRLRLSAGFLVSVIKFEELRVFKKIDIDTVTVTSSVTPGGFDTHYLPVEKKINQQQFDISFKTIEIPLLASYVFKKEKIDYEVNAGISYSYLFSAKSLLFYSNDSLNVHEVDNAREDNRLRQHNWFLNFGANVSYALNEKLNIYGGPALRFGLYSFYSKDYVIKQRPNFIGIEAGLKYYF